MDVILVLLFVIAATFVALVFAIKAKPPGWVAPASTSKADGMGPWTRRWIRIGVTIGSLVGVVSADYYWRNRIISGELAKYGEPIIILILCAVRGAAIFALFALLWSGVVFFVGWTWSRIMRTREC